MKNLFIKGIPDDVFKRMKIAALQQDMRMKEFIVAVIEAYLSYQEQEKKG